ncbi:hypothetical protein MCOR19_005291 [Pyricularia oryzae]|nr:hypothetical protein MCOR19_005291 [Pyricularia oryzae]KAI6479356.1 hypothetical protein MCOR18_005714 [Pyricularia oryzae]KAI6490704.1 hypothetical protein MCOR11_007376 [Pyricularia oryzae]KAI6595688.1 hypothetical protein MCOR06_002828 [Pyricularia oryzae]
MATSIGRLQAALSSVTSEVTVAAANINFDFTLVKCEAPAEYRSLEQQLTPARKAEAECGSLHVTARRLGALFEEICPVAPRLIGAFGKRASEITQKANQKSTPLPSAARSIFSDYIGVDICALWAAATSSKAALPLFLLACMLARIWDDAEATALWCEIVKDRRMDIASRLEAGEPVPYTAVSAAAQQDIPREQLAKWDASARAFLKTADDTWSMQQKQFNLIAHNIDVPVNRGNDQRPYHGIVATWTNAMKTLEKLICGQPHAVLDGSILLGISSWHIYPDMTVFGSGPGKHVMMRDSLVNSGGVISVGVKYSSPLGPGSQHGVFWSLSLGHYKFYGKPTNKVSRLNEDRSRLTFSELQVATIGALLSHWNIPVAMTEGALKCLLKIVSFLPHDAEDRSDVWIKILTDSLVMCLSESENTAALISLGRRRSVFISSEDRPGNRRANQATKYFGLTKPPYHLLDLMEDAAGFGSSYGGVTVATLGLDDREAWEIGPVEANNDDKLGLGVLRGSTKYRHLIGRLSSVAVFVIDDNGDDIRLPILEHEDITGCIDCGLISPKALKSALTGRNFKLEEKLDDEVILTFCNLGLASIIYKSLSLEGATISPRALSSPLNSIFRKNRSDAGTELPAHFYTLDKIFNRGTSWRIVTFFETGQTFMGVEGKEPPLGLAIGDSIFLPRKLLVDPSKSPNIEDFEVGRLLGSFGNSGLTILQNLDPNELMARELDACAWRVTLGKFSGEPRDDFTKTSLHLGFTGWQAPVFGEQSIGMHFPSANLLQVFVSVRDSGEWVADVDILGMLMHKDVIYLKSNQTCTHQGQRGKTGAASAVDSLPEGILSVETWDQILDLPEGWVVARAYGNWVSRLAIASVAALHCRLREKRVYICPQDKDWCWLCLEEEHRNAIFVY